MNGQLLVQLARAMYSRQNADGYSTLPLENANERMINTHTHTHTHTNWERSIRPTIGMEICVRVYVRNKAVN